MGKLFNDITSDLSLPSESELIEETRRAKISMHHKTKMKYDPEYRKMKQEAPLKTAEIKRKIPVEDYMHIVEEFYNIEGRRPDFFEFYCKKYNVLLSAIERICYNTLNDIPKTKYNKLKKAYYKKYPVSETRSATQKQRYKNMTDEQKQQLKLNISIAQDPVDEQTALDIYYECRYKRTQKAYQQCAKKHLDKNGKKIPWQKVRDIVNGHHYATQHFDIEADVKKYRLKVYGTFKFISPEGKVFHFEDEKTCGEWMLSMDKSLKRDSDPYRVCVTKFDSIMPNTPTLMRRRFWIGWTLENIKHED